MTIGEDKAVLNAVMVAKSFVTSDSVYLSTERQLSADLMWLGDLGIPQCFGKRFSHRDGCSFAAIRGNR